VTSTTETDLTCRESFDYKPFRKTPFIGARPTREAQKRLACHSKPEQERKRRGVYPITPVCELNHTTIRRESCILLNEIEFHFHLKRITGA
jgi:hypothetical protein